MPTTGCASNGAERAQTYAAEWRPASVVAERARRRRAVVGADWDPGGLSMLQSLFALPIPRAETEVRGARVAVMRSAPWHAGAGEVTA